MPTEPRIHETRQAVRKETYLDGPYGNLRVWAILMAVLSLTTGAGVLRRFLRDHPVIEDRMPDAN